MKFPIGSLFIAYHHHGGGLAILMGQEVRSKNRIYSILFLTNAESSSIIITALLYDRAYFKPIVVAK